jgi:hypothetical protein
VLGGLTSRRNGAVGCAAAAAELWDVRRPGSRERGVRSRRPKHRGMTLTAGRAAWPQNGLLHRGGIGHRSTTRVAEGAAVKSARGHGHGLQFVTGVLKSEPSPNIALQRTRSAPLREPLSFETLGHTEQP